MLFTDALTSDSQQDNPASFAVSIAPDDGVYLSDYSPKDKPWDVHRAATDSVALLYLQDAEFQRLGARVSSCSGFLLFAWAVDQATGEKLFRLRGAHFCHVRHCPVCQWRRSMMWQAKFYQALPALQAEHPKARWIFLTLTVKNCPVTELRETLKAMGSAWQRLIQRQEFRPVLGFVRTTEVTRGDDGLAHPHFHALLMVSTSYFGRGYVPQARWVELWRECGRFDYVPVVDVRAVKGDLGKAVQETLKYSVKPSDMRADGDFLLELTRQVHHMRFVATGGVLKGVLKPDKAITDEDMTMAENGSEGVVELSDEPRLGFAWEKPTKRYRRAKTGD